MGKTQSGDRVVGSRKRVAQMHEGRSNIHLGAMGMPVELADVAREIAVRASKAVGPEISGVDLIFCGGEPGALESTNPQTRRPTGGHERHRRERHARVRGPEGVPVSESNMTHPLLDRAMPEEAIPGSRVKATTKHGALTVDELAEMQPGMARLMDELAHRFWVLYYAAKGGNWDLARYMEKESEKLLSTMGKVRPKYAEDLARFVREDLAPVLTAIESRDWEGFDASYRVAVDSSDTYHTKYNKGFLRFRLPDRPPEWFDLGPR